MFPSIDELSFGLFFSISQTVKLSGKVFGEKNNPISGVSIKIVGTSSGTSTDIEGRFSISITVGKKYELEFSSVEYETKIIEVETQNGQVDELNVLLTVKTKVRKVLLFLQKQLVQERKL
jgi:hypothetical protein